jgi:hypothetical protein
MVHDFSSKYKDYGKVVLKKKEYEELRKEFIKLNNIDIGDYKKYKERVKKYGS